MRELTRSVRLFFKQADKLLFLLALAASLAGLLLVRSATLSYGTDRYTLVQGIALALGIAVYFIFSLTDLEYISGLWRWAFFTNLLLIASLLLFGVGGAETGNNSWLRFSLFGISTGIQPGEVAKVIFIVTFARHIAETEDATGEIWNVVKLLLHFALPAGLLLFVSGDYGMVLAFVFIFLCMAFTGGMPFRYFLLLFGAAAAASPLIWTYALKDYHRERILVLLNPEMDPLGAGYHAIQSKTALGAGQMLGRGLFQGPQTQYGHLPAKHTDFIFSVAGEELGFVGCLLIMLLLTALIARIIHVGLRSQNRLSSLVCNGVAAMLIFQTFENIGMCIGLTPVIGVTLPFISYGGSSLLVCFAALGLVSSVRRHTMMKQAQHRSLY